MSLKVTLTVFLYSTIAIIRTTAQASSYQIYDVDEQCSGLKSVTLEGHPKHAGLILVLSSKNSPEKGRALNCALDLNIRDKVWYDQIVVATKIFRLRDGECVHFQTYTQSKDLCGPVNSGVQSVGFVLTNTSVKVTIALKSPADDEPSNFKLVITPNLKGSSVPSGCPKGDAFETCKNGNCIWKGMVCDGHNNCGDNSDEMCDYWTLAQFAIVASFTLAVFAIVTSLIYAVCRGGNETEEEKQMIPQINVAFTGD